MAPRRVTFPSGSLTLEGVWHFPEGFGPWGAVVVCHPHPRYGGTMENNVVLAVCQALEQNSLAAFRFNFRGVGRSQGEFGGGVGEQEDLKAALALVAGTESIDDSKIGVVGYSFGATIALTLGAEEPNVRGLVAISPPLASFTHPWSHPKPKLLIVGDRDSFISLPQFSALTEALPEPKTSLVMAGADHFWRGYEVPLAQKAATFLVEALV